MEALYARTEHGGHRVFPLAKGFEVEWPEGRRRYRSARQTIIALVNKTPDPQPGAYDPKWPADRYFRRGRYQRSPDLAIDVFDLFKPDPPQQVTISANVPQVNIGESTLAVHIPKPKPAPPPLGIDLAARGHEVRKIFFKGFARKVIRMGYDPEDVLQEVYKALLVRNGGKCPFDSRKSSFAHYVHMVCNGQISNYHRRYSRLDRNEVFGVPSFERGIIDVAEADLSVVGPEQEDIVQFESATGSLTIRVSRAAEAEGRDPSIARQCIQFLLDGMCYKEMAAALKVSVSLISDTVHFIRRVATEWREELQPVM